jgi:2-polyprenyl-3-methyl-5-hydroxy-6-metoxy-1,4-benzoquinol methylase
MSYEQQNPMVMGEEHIHEAVFDLVQKYLHLPVEVADVGAGQGAFSLRLNKIGHKVTALDVDIENWKLPEVEFIGLNLDSEFAAKINQKFDAVVAIEIIEHLENPFSFVRECAKLLKPNGLLFLSTPNVEAVNSRLMFLFKGRLRLFDDWTTVRMAHITPIFKWKLDMCLDESNFKVIEISSGKQVFHLGSNLKGKLAGVFSRIIRPFVKGNKDGEGWIVVAKLEEN